MPRAQSSAARDFTIACSVCGKVAIRVCPIAQSSGILKAILSEAEFVCEGITRSFALRADGVERVFAWLADDDCLKLGPILREDARDEHEAPFGIRLEHCGLALRKIVTDDRLDVEAVGHDDGVGSAYEK